MIACPRSRRWLAFDKDAFAPVISLHRTVDGETHLLHPWNLRQVRVQLPVKCFQLAGGVTCHLWIDVGDEAIRGYKAEVLVLHIAQAPGEQSGGAKQDDGESRLHDDQGL